MQLGKLLTVLALALCAGEAEAAIQCYQCHGTQSPPDYRPVDAAYRAVTSGGFRGNHRTHMPAGVTPTACTPCHDSTGYTSSHRDAKVRIASNINTSPATGAYSKGSGFAQSATAAGGTCSNVNCHFEKTTPAWGSSPFAAPGDCNRCHEAPPATVDPGSHAKHDAYFPGTASCGKCHADHLSDSNPFAHATSAGKRNLVVQPRDRFNTAGGSYGGATNDYLPSQNNTFGNCTATYCHSPGTKASSYDAPNQAATWGSSLGTSCLGCHRGDAASGSAMQTGSHGPHVNGSAVSAIDCAKCHAGTATNSRTIADMALHLNRKVDIAFDPALGAGTYGGAASPVAKDVGTAFGQCRNIYCHSDGTTTTAPFNRYTAVWGMSTFPTNCTGCHGGAAGTSRVMATNNHRKHVDASFNPGVGTAFGCVDCHAKTVSNNTTIGTKPNHLNRFKDYSGVKAGKIAGGSCNTVYCHSSGQHSPAYRTIVAWSDTTTTYSCNGCHGSYGTATLSAAPPAGSFATQFGEPNYNNYSSVDRNWFNSHNQKHVKSANDCSKCHYNTTRDGVSLLGGSTLHANATQDVTFDTAVAGGTAIYNNLTRRCSNVYCHSNGRSTGRVYANPRWGGTANCNACHPITSLSGAHATHVGGMLPTFYVYTGNHAVAAAYRFGCANCHPVDGTRHLNGQIDLSLNKNDAGAGSLKTRNSVTNSSGIGSAGSGLTGATGTSVRCSGVYCHSNGYPANLVYATTPDWYGGTFTGDRCAGCHGNAPNTTVAGSKSHYNRSFLGYTSNPGGHQIGIHAMNIYSSPRGLAKAGTTGKSSHGNAITATTVGCNVCHYATVTSPRNDGNFVCRTCHFAGNTAGALSGNAADIADRSVHVNGVVDVAFQPVAVISKAQMRVSYFSAYSGVWNRNGGYKASGARDTAKQALNTATMWDAGTKTCSNVACHNGRSVKWTDNNGATGCLSCHQAL